MYISSHVDSSIQQIAKQLGCETQVTHVTVHVKTIHMEFYLWSVSYSTTTHT